jgi:hypothetical protein
VLPGAEAETVSPFRFATAAMLNCSCELEARSSSVDVCRPMCSSIARMEHFGVVGKWSATRKKFRPSSGNATAMNPD